MLHRTDDVTLVSNPEPSLSTHQWVATNVKSMNRTNKMSSPPFWIPNDRSPRHQFRFVLLRGIVKAATEEQDPIAVYLEYLPQRHSEDNSANNNNNSNNDPTVVNTNATTAPSLHHPETCRIAVWCLRKDAIKEKNAAALPAPPPRGPPHLYAEETFTFQATTRVMGFRDLVPAKELYDDSFVDPEALNAMILRVEIQTGVTSVVDTVAKVTDRWASSFWGSAVSAFSAIQTGLTAVKSQVSHVIEDRLEAVTGTNTTDESAKRKASNNSRISNSSSSAAKGLPWDKPPVGWIKAGRSAEQWRVLLTEHLAEDEGTFLYGAHRTGGSTPALHVDEQVLLTQLHVNHKAVLAAASIFNYDRDVHEGLLSAPRLRQQRYHLVPARVKDNVFWENYMWKVAALATCVNEDQIKLLLSIVNSPPKHKTAATPRGDTTNSATSSNIATGSAGTGTSGSVASTAVSGDAAAEVLMKEALDAAAVLEELLAEYFTSDTDTTPRCAPTDSDRALIATALQSCESYLERLVQLQGGQGDSYIDAHATVKTNIRRAEVVLNTTEEADNEKKEKQDAESGNTNKNEETNNNNNCENIANEENTTSAEKKNEEDKHSAKTEEDCSPDVRSPQVLNNDCNDNALATELQQQGGHTLSLKPPAPAPVVTMDNNTSTPATTSTTASPTTTVVQTRASSSTVGEARKGPAPTRLPRATSTGSTASKKIVFEPMPWDE